MVNIKLFRLAAMAPILVGTLQAENLNLETTPPFTTLSGKRYVVVEKDGTVAFKATTDESVYDLSWIFTNGAPGTGSTDDPSPVTYGAQAEGKECAVKFTSRRYDEDDNHCVTTKKTTCTVVVPKIEFKETAANNGFDDTTTPKWFIVPKGDNPASNKARVEITPPKGIELLSFEVETPAKCTIDTATATASPHDFTFTGVAKGETRCRVKVNNSSPNRYLTAELKLAVKEKKTQTVSLHWISDNAGHATSGSAADADAIIADLNTLYNTQANITFTKKQANAVAVAKDLGTCVEWTAVPATNEWTDVVGAAKDSGADINVYVVWSYEQDGTPATNNAAGGTLGTDCIVEDGRNPSTIAHEIGHALGLGHNTTDNRCVMYTPSASRRKFLKAEADTINP